MNDKSTESETSIQERPGPKPDELGGVYFSSFVKIHDPNTKEILVQTRGD